MAAARTKAPVEDPRTTELPPEPPPRDASEIEFQTVFNPVLVGGVVKWFYEITEHNAKQYVGDFTGLKEATSFESLAEAELHARRFVDRIRDSITVKLHMPAPVKMVL